MQPKSSKPSLETSIASNPHETPSLESRRTGQLWPQTQFRLGTVSVELAWLQIQVAYSNMMVRETDLLNQMCQGRGFDPDEVLPDLTRKYAPETVLNRVAQENPKLDLRKMGETPAVEIVTALFNSLTI